MSIGMQYQSTWESIKQHTTPSWFKKAKYGIYAHWGPYSVPAAGPNVTWYPYWMYREPSPQFDYHVKHFGHPSKFGYKDFVLALGYKGKLIENFFKKKNYLISLIITKI